MAINPSTNTEYAGQVDAPSAEFPYGSARNDALPGDQTGTPRVASEIKDTQGLQQSLLSSAGLTPTGVPDEVGASQYFDAMRLNAIALSLNVTVAEVNFGRTGYAVVQFLHDEDAPEKTYCVPDDAIGKTVDSVVGNVLNTTVDGPYQLEVFSTKNIEINIVDFGAHSILEPGYSNFDSSDAIQAALYFAAGGVTDPNVVTPLVTAVKVIIPNGYFRYTKQIHHPAWVVVEGESGASISANGLQQKTATGSILYADFADPWQTSWLSSGFSLNVLSGAPVGELIDPYKVVTASLSYDSVYITRSYGSTLRGVIFYTDKFVAVARGVVAASGARDDFCAHGFLTSYITNSSWGADSTLSGTSMHCGILNFNSNGATNKGYINRDSDPLQPVLDATTAPAGWREGHPVHNPPATEFLTTAHMNQFGNANNLTGHITEGWGRGKLFANVEGVTDTTPYLEGIDEMGYHCIGSRVSVTSPQVFISKGLGFVASGGSLDIKSMKFNTLLDYGSQETSGAVARLSATYPNQESVAAEEEFSLATDFAFEENKPLSIYISPTGDDTKCGLNEDNSVQSLNVALDRAIHYNASIIKIEDGATVNYLEAVVVQRIDIRIEPVTPASSATVVIDAGADGYGNHLILDTASLNLNNVALSMEGTFSGSASGRGWINPINESSFSTNADITFTDDPVNLGLFVMQSSTACALHFTMSGGVYTGNNLGMNAFDASAAGKAITSITTASGAPIWANQWTVI